MKVVIGKYVEYVGPHQLAEKLLFWRDRFDDSVLALGDKIAGTFIGTFLEWVESKRNVKRDIRIDSYDTWNMDSQLAYIIVPMLKQIRDTKHGYPAELTEQKWDKILNHMIWSFTEVNNDEGDDKFFSDGGPRDSKDPLASLMPRKCKIDIEGLKKYEESVQKGITLFGKYYRHLWD